MNTGSTCKLCQTADCILNFARCNHHKVSKLVYHDHDLRHTFRSFFPFRNTHSINLSIVFLQIADAKLRKSIVTAHHLCNSPVQCTGSLFRVSHYRNQQMWNSVVYTQFYYFRVDHDKFDIFRCRLIQNADNQRVDTYRFTGTGCSRNQKMWHLRDICYDRFTCNIFADGKCQF